MLDAIPTSPRSGRTFSVAFFFNVHGYALVPKVTAHFNEHHRHDITVPRHK